MSEPVFGPVWLCGESFWPAWWQPPAGLQSSKQVLAELDGGLDTAKTGGVTLRRLPGARPPVPDVLEMLADAGGKQVLLHYAGRHFPQLKFMREQDGTWTVSERLTGRQYTGYAGMRTEGIEKLLADRKVTSACYLESLSVLPERWRC